jgi:hypothetical protein
MQDGGVGFKAYFSENSLISIVVCGREVMVGEEFSSEERMEPERISLQPCLAKSYDPSQNLIALGNTPEAESCCLVLLW